MATINYKCDQCKRETELVENSTGFTIIGKCNITEGCRGRLYKTGRNPNNVRETSPTFVEGLSNYVPRKSLVKFSQTLPSEIWEITHNMGVFPSTIVYHIGLDNKLHLVDNDNYLVTANDKNKITITHPKKERGIVHCIARSSVPQIPDVLPPLDTLFQVSNNGVFTFAVPKYIVYTTGDKAGTTFNVSTSTKPVRLEIEIRKPNDEPFICFETIPQSFSSNSPWNGWNEIIVTKRKTYVTKTIDILKMRIFGLADLKASDIPNGTQIRILNVDYGDGVVHPINTKSVLALLAASPYKYADKIKDKLVDIGEIRGSNPNYFVYNDGEFFIDNSLVEPSYPDINRFEGNKVVPIPSPSVSATPTPTPSVTPTISGTPAITPSGTPSVTPTGTPQPTPTQTPQQSLPFVGCDGTYVSEDEGYHFPYPRELLFNLGNSTGTVRVAFDTGTVPDRLIIVIGSTTVLDTGYYGDTSMQAELNDILIANGLPTEAITQSAGVGQFDYFEFEKTMTDNIARAYIFTPTGGGRWRLQVSCPEQIGT